MRRASLPRHEAVDSLTLSTRLGEALSQGPAGDLLLFVHGYNTPFGGAAERAARLAVELQYPGAVVLYTWPSDGSLASYRADQGDARASGVHLARFLRELQLAAPGRRLSVLAHSMGSEVLASALRQLDSTRQSLALGEVTLVSPDLAADDFLERMPRCVPAPHVTVYAASADCTLVIGEQSRTALDSAGGSPRRHAASRSRSLRRRMPSDTIPFFRAVSERPARPPGAAAPCSPARAGLAPPRRRQGDVAPPAPVGAAGVQGAQKPTSSTSHSSDGRAGSSLSITR
jgi:alpha-beta hydrolase superfamily lysophospholipase